MHESCSYGSVRGGDGNVPTYSAGGIQQSLLAEPASARAGYIGPVLLAGVQCFFLNETWRRS
jgi:hypothetical protein